MGHVSRNQEKTQLPLLCFRQMAANQTNLSLIIPNSLKSYSNNTKINNMFRSSILLDIQFKLKTSSPLSIFSPFSTVLRFILDFSTFIYNVLHCFCVLSILNGCLQRLPDCAPLYTEEPRWSWLALIVHLQTKLWHLCPMGAVVRAEGSWGGIHKSVGFKLTITLVKALHVPPLSHSFRCLNVTTVVFPGSWSSSSVGGMNANSSEQMERMWRNRTLAVGVFFWLMTQVCSSQI